MSPEELKSKGIPLHLVMRVGDPITSCCQIPTTERRPDGADVWVTTNPGQATCKGRGR